MMPDQPRCVWLTRDQAIDVVGNLEAAKAVLAAWDAAPADAVARSAEAIRIEITGLDGEDAWYAASAACKALGMPEAPDA